jgi:hypothetical protein
LSERPSLFFILALNVCTCFSFSCSTKTHSDIDGQSRRGHLVSTTTRSAHRAKDRDVGELIHPIGDRVCNKSLPFF